MTIPRVQVFAVVRFDNFISNTENAISVLEILPTAEQASAEADRLNALNGAKGCQYFVRATRYYPEGRAEIELESD
jgi:hypothetical protein